MEKKKEDQYGHTFTDKEGEFVFGPLCPDKYYEIQIWVDRVRHSKICATCKHEASCLKGIDLDCKKPHKPCEEFDKCCDFIPGDKPLNENEEKK